MNSLRKQAARLAIFLECAGQVPAARGSTYKEQYASLEKQYCSLEPKLRRRARIEGRRLIRARGIGPMAIRLIAVPAPVCDLTKLSPVQRRRVRAEYRKRIRRRSPQTPLCPRCMIAPGMPKRSWPSRELAEQARLRQNDPRLHVYPCPAQPNYWHIGHRR